MTTTRQLLAACIALLLSCGLRAQERGRFAGWVADDNGKRVIGADVTLISRPFPSRPDIGIADELHVCTEADGMFRTKLLHGRSYSAWAVWRDEDNVQRRTEILEGAFPGPPRAIKAADLQTIRTVRIKGADKWRARAPLHLTAITASENVAEIPVRLDANLVAKLPTLPGGHCSLEVRGKDGLILGMAASLALAQKDKPELTIELSEPRELRIVIVDKQGKPVSGATIRHAFGYHKRDLTTVIGKTDEGGVLQATLPSVNPMYVKPDKDLCSFQITAPGRQRMFSWTHLDKVGDVLTLTMPAGSDLIGRVLAKNGSPATGITLLPDCYAMGADNALSGNGVPPRVLTLAQDGGFRFSSLHPQHDFRLLALIEPKAAIAQGMRLRNDIAVAPVVWLAVGAPPFQTPHKLDGIRLDRIAIAQIRVTTDTGTPVPGARLTVTTQDLYNSPIHYVCDRVGRLQFPLPNGTIRIGAWFPGGGVATMLVSSPLADGAPEIDPLVIKLSATQTVRGVIVDAAGKPVQGVKVYQGGRGKTDDRQIRELSFLARATSNKTGPDGSFSLTLPLDDVPFSVQCFGKVNGETLVSKQIVILPDDPDNGRLRIAVAPFKKK
ncbi:MAG TPA: hypothetical protein EYP98_05110 [Planctomycetes bacterium]|nr:hypothetical protein [Planctomycetota bacterium]